MRATSFFRDAHFPSARDDRLTHERFLLDTYADRRAEASESTVSALARRLRRLVGADRK